MLFPFGNEKGKYNVGPCLCWNKCCGIYFLQPYWKREKDIARESGRLKECMGERFIHSFTFSFLIFFLFLHNGIVVFIVFLAALQRNVDWFRFVPFCYVAPSSKPQHDVKLRRCLFLMLIMTLYCRRQWWWSQSLLKTWSLLVLGTYSRCPVWYTFTYVHTYILLCVCTI